MRLHFDLSEYENDEDGGSRVLVTVTIPDGEPHSRVTDIYEKTVSMLYGYDIKTKITPEFLGLDDEEESRGCPDCVQGTCVFGCGKEFR